MAAPGGSDMSWCYSTGSNSTMHPTVFAQITAPQFPFPNTTPTEWYRQQSADTLGATAPVYGGHTLTNGMTNYSPYPSSAGPESVILPGIRTSVPTFTATPSQGVLGAMVTPTWPNTMATTSMNTPIPPAGRFVDSQGAGNSITPATIDVPVPSSNTTKRQPRRYSCPKPSLYCHVCARQERTEDLMPCGNVRFGKCLKTICIRCLQDIGVNWPVVLYNSRLVRAGMAAGLYPEPSEGKKVHWICTHCTENCPPNAKCFSYDKQTERRRERVRQAKAAFKELMNIGLEGVQAAAANYYETLEMEVEMTNDPIIDQILKNPDLAESPCKDWHDMQNSC